MTPNCKLRGAGWAFESRSSEKTDLTSLLSRSSRRSDGGAWEPSATSGLRTFVIWPAQPTFFWIYWNGDSSHLKNGCVASFENLEDLANLGPYSQNGNWGLGLLESILLWMGRTLSQLPQWEQMLPSLTGPARWQQVSCVCHLSGGKDRRLSHSDSEELWKAWLRWGVRLRGNRKPTLACRVDILLPLIAETIH